MARSPTSKVSRRQHRSQITLPVVETVRERWLSKDRRQFEKCGFTDTSQQHRLVDAWADIGSLDTDQSTYVSFDLGDTYVMPQAQAMLGGNLFDLDDLEVDP